jgi:hypothetical protein
MAMLLELPLPEVPAVEDPVEPPAPAVAPGLPLAPGLLVAPGLPVDPAPEAVDPLPGVVVLELALEPMCALVSMN